MKTSKDPRHIKRIKIMQELYAQSFREQTQSPETKEVILNLKKIDRMIAEAAPAWPINKINKIDLAILRLAVFELTLTQTPHKVIVDEAVELGKEYGGESTASFVNGVLGKLISLQKS